MKAVLALHQDEDRRLVVRHLDDDVLARVDEP